MKKLLLLFVFLISAYSSFSQNSNELSDIQKIIYDNETVQVKAEFPDGEQKFNEFVLKNFNKPVDKSTCTEILVSFIVEIDGSISNIEVIRDAGNGTGDEIKRGLITSPKWLPAEHEGYRVKAKVTFSLKL